MAGKGGQTIIIKKKKKGGHGGAHGGAWKVAYADFVTAMMAFFMVMWLMGSDESVKASIEGYFNQVSSDSALGIAPTEPKGGEALRSFQDRRPTGGRPMDMPAGKIHTATSPEAELQEIKELLEESISLELGMTSLADQVQMVYDSKGLVLRIAVKDFFEPYSTTVKPDLIPVLHRIGKVLSVSSRLIRVEGHTDPSEANTQDYSSPWELSAARAGWVASYWQQHFKTLNPNRIQVAGNAHHRPIADSDTEQGRSANRRVEIIVLNNEFSQ